MRKIILTGRFMKKIKPNKDHFGALCHSIIYQQLSTKSADSIAKKFLGLFNKNKPTPDKVARLTNAKFRSAGISQQKESYLRDLARKFLNGNIVPQKFSRMTDLEIKDHLIQVHGIGPWTADMFLIFTLKRPNVLPVGDLGIKNGFKKYFRLKNLPTEDKMYALAKPYSGRWSELSLFLWDFKDNK